jgi:hypothetical protein
MKTLITAAALAAILTTPALAEKTLVKPVCNSHVEMLEAQILVLKQELAILSQVSAVPKPKKPVDNEKAG